MRKKGEPSLEVNLPITPFLDMSFQLLFFFIMSFNPNTEFEGHMALALPSGLKKAAKDPSKIDPIAKDDKQDIEFKSEVSVFVTYHENSDPTVSVEDPKGKKLLGSDMSELVEHLKTVQKDLSEKQSISVQGDGNLRWGDMVRVMDACRTAGFKNVSFTAPPGFNLGT